MSRLSITEMDCVHDHVRCTMTCSWLGGEIRIVVDWLGGSLGIFRGGSLVESRCLSEISIAEFVRIQEQCQLSAEGLSVFLGDGISKL